MAGRCRAPRCSARPASAVEAPPPSSRRQHENLARQAPLKRAATVVHTKTAQVIQRTRYPLPPNGAACRAICFRNETRELALGWTRLEDSPHCLRRRELGSAE